MNDPNKKIEIDKSSLLSLKAELLRKQEEVSRAKAFNSIDDFVPRRVPKPEKPLSSSGKSKVKSSTATSVVVELEDSAQLERSKQVLVAKARYYDRMVASGGSLNSDENCLVMFNQKMQTEKPFTEQKYTSSDDSLSSDEEDNTKGMYYEDKHPNDDWVEYIDCLGRNRKCLRKDLAECLRKDKDLARATSPREGQRREGSKDASGDVDDADDEDGEIIGPVPSMAITEDTIGERFREMREQWAAQEAENLEKDSVHYQDVLFDEARQHGVGYYEFSTDREERARQQHELDSIREATIEAQKEKEDLRKARDKIIADRMKAARARQRARQGLPPEEEVEEAAKPEQSEAREDELYDTTEEKKRLKAEAKARKKKEKEERKKERERLKHVRPWDEGKQRDEELDWKPAREWHVMSQEEWNEMKRKERISEFAPSYEKSPSTMQPSTGIYVPSMSRNDEHEQDEEDDDDEDGHIGPLPSDRYSPEVAIMANNPLFPLSGDAPEEVSMPTIPGMEDIFLSEAPNRALYFTTKKKKVVKWRNYEASTLDSGPAKKAKQEQESVPFKNELSDNSNDEDESVLKRDGVEIAPPPTWDYYGPTSTGKKKSRQPPVTKTALESSIEAGLKFLREQSDKGGPNIGTKNKWSSNADY